MPQSEFKLITIALCGPKDVAKEIGIAQKVIDGWNRRHGERYKVLLRHQHWSTDSYPDLGNRAQAAINRQMVDDSDIIVAVLWSRLGTPTEFAGSGTEEEIRRGVTLGKKVLVYFSTLEPLPADADRGQLDRLDALRNQLFGLGLCWKFSSRRQFEDDFMNHLANVVDDLMRRSDGERRQAQPFSPSISGDHNKGNFLAGRDINVFHEPPKVRHVVERREDSISRTQARQIQLEIGELAEGTIGVSRSGAYGMWWERFKRKFEVSAYGELPAARFDEAMEWCREQKAIQTRGLKAKARDEWRRKRITAIKAAMNSMHVTKDMYYPDLSRRLKMRKPFTSLTRLTKQDLDRVYRMAMSDAKQIRK